MAKVSVVHAAPPDCPRGTQSRLPGVVSSPRFGPSTIKTAYTYTLDDVFLPWCARNQISEVEQLNQRVLDRFTAELLDSPASAGSPCLSTPSITMSAWSGSSWPGARPRARRLPASRSFPASPSGSLNPQPGGDRQARAVRSCGTRQADHPAPCRHRDPRGRAVRTKGGRHRHVAAGPQSLSQDPGQGLKGATRSDRPAVDAPPGSLSARPTGRGPQTPGLRLSRRNAQGDFASLTPSGILQLLRRTAERAGIDRRVHPHLFRHSFATEALRRGMNPVQLAQLLGHSGLRMIEQVYAHLNAADGYEAVMRMLTSER